MMYLLGKRQFALLLAHLAERMRFDEAVADTLPTSAVAFVRLGITLVLVVLLVHDLLMLSAVLLAYSKPTAAGVGTGTLWFNRHGTISFITPVIKSDEFARFTWAYIRAMPREKNTLSYEGGCIYEYTV